MMLVFLHKWVIVFDSTYFLDQLRCIVSYGLTSIEVGLAEIEKCVGRYGILAGRSFVFIA
jgi:hypothetical protein